MVIGQFERISGIPTALTDRSELEKRNLGYLGMRVSKEAL
jgi:hypothetical protein